MIIRENGFYWVRQSELGWIVAQYAMNAGGSQYWFIGGIDQALVDTDFEEIDERKIERYVTDF